jgi:hypothetical protein
MSRQRHARLRSRRRRAIDRISLCCDRLFSLQSLTLRPMTIIPKLWNPVMDAENRESRRYIILPTTGLVGFKDQSGVARLGNVERPTVAGRFGF